MKPNLVLASNNQHKIQEFQEIITTHQIISLNQVNFNRDIDETGNTFEQNALIKCQEVYKHIQAPIISDDSGLCVQALNNEPGVFSARYAGNAATDQLNVQKLLQNMAGIENRKAMFVCVICYFISPSQYFFFKGELHGEIAFAQSGSYGFGYDPIFIPQNHKKTLASYSAVLKNKISHRAIAVKSFQQFLLNSK